MWGIKKLNLAACVGPGIFMTRPEVPAFPGPLMHESDAPGSAKQSYFGFVSVKPQ